MKNQFDVSDQKAGNRSRPRLFTRDFTLVVIGQIISLFGNAILRFAMPLFLLEQTGSASLFALVSACSFLPLIVFSPVGGMIADRVNKRNIMVVLDFSTAVLVLGFSIALDRVPLTLLLLITLMLLYGIQGAYQPSVQASIPALVAQENLISGNAIINQVSSLSGLIGPAIGGVLYSAWGLRSVLTVSIVCFVFSAVMELFIRIPFVKREKEGSAWDIVKGDLSESIQFVRKERPELGEILGVLVGINLFLSAMLVVGLPVLITQRIGLPEHLTSQLYGYSQGMIAAGGLCGGVLAGAICKRVRVNQSGRVLMAIAVMILPMGLTLFFQAPAMVSYGVITGFSFLIMLLASILNIQLMSYVQAVTPGHMIGKVISCMMAVSICAQPVGQILYGTLFEYFKGAPWLVMIAAAVIIGIIAVISQKGFSHLVLERPSKGMEQLNPELE